MERKTIEDWLKVLDEEFDITSIDGDSASYKVRDSVSENGFKIESEDQYGGEDMGSEYWFVFKLTDTNTNEVAYIKYEGYYNSWSGTDWEEPYLVEPKEVTVIKYSKI